MCRGYCYVTGRPTHQCLEGRAATTCALVLIAQRRGWQNAGGRHGACDECGSAAAASTRSSGPKLWQRRARTPAEWMRHGPMLHIAGGMESSLQLTWPRQEGQNLAKSQLRRGSQPQESRKQAQLAKTPQGAAKAKAKAKTKAHPKAKADASVRKGGSVFFDKADLHAQWLWSLVALAASSRRTRARTGTASSNGRPCVGKAAPAKPAEAWCMDSRSSSSCTAPRCKDVCSATARPRHC